MRNDLKELAVVMNTLAEEYGIEINEIKIQTWEEILLKPYGIEKIKLAATKILKADRKFKTFPKISEMIHAIEGDKPKSEEIALSQFMAAKQAIIDVSSYSSVSFDDCIIHKVIDSMGGWPEFCITDNSQWHWKEKEFVERYVRFKAQYDASELDYTPEYLPGVHGNSPSNIKLGYKPKIYEVKTNYPCIPIKRIESRNFMKELNERMKGAKK